MKKAILFLVILSGLALLEPRSRAQIMQLVGPIGGREHSAERALKRIADEVQRTAAETGIYPQPGDFDRWLVQSHGSAEDPWGSPYYLELFADSFVVGSPGPDTRRQTSDDLRLSQPRNASPSAMGQPTTPVATPHDYSPPAPPSSGVKSKAIERARRAREK